MEVKKRIYRLGFILSALVLSSLVVSKDAVAKTDLKLTPPSLSLSAGQTATIEIKVDTTDKVFGGDLIIKYDATAINVDKVEVGKFWQTPQVLINRVDGSSGKVYLSVFSYPAVSGGGAIANLAIKQVGNKGNTISLDGLTTLAGENGQKITYTAQAATISFIEPIVTTIPVATITVMPSPTLMAINPTTALNTQPPIQVSASVSSSSPTVETGPTIILEQTPTPVMEKARSSLGFTLQLVALFLLVFGTLAFFTFKKNF